jgi:hypothetical protein
MSFLKTPNSAEEMWTKGIIRKCDKIQQGKFVLSRYNKQNLYNLLNNDEVNINDLKEIIHIDEMYVKACWLANQENEINDYVEGIGLEWLPKKTKTEHNASIKLKGLLAICELYDDEKLKLFEIRKISWETTIYAGISALKEMHEIMDIYDMPLAMFLIGQPKSNI